MNIQRTIPPAAAPIELKSLLHGLSGIFMGYKYRGKIEGEIKRYFGVKHVFLASSGKAALAVILLALKSLSNKKEVLISAYTCFSVPSAIVKAGLKVSLCDINPSTFDFDYNLLKKAINKDTLCVMPNHLFGIPADMDKINSLCKNKGVFVVEDAAQAMGASYKGKKLGTLGDVGFFSLGRGKNITCGSGGIIITNSSNIAAAIEKHYINLKEAGIIESLKEFLQVLLMAVFIRPSLYWLPSGLPFLKLGQTTFYKDFPIKKLSGIQAGLLHGWQEKLEEANQIRRKNAEYFEERLRLRLRSRQKLRLRLRLRLSNGNTVSFLRLPLMAESREIRDEIFSLSNKKGLGVSAMYPMPINEIEEIRNQFNGSVFPSAKRISETLLTIPTHHLLSEKDKERISILLQ